MKKLLLVLVVAFGCDKGVDEAKEKAAKLEQQRAQAALEAEKAAEAAKQELDALMKQQAELDAKVSEAVNLVVGAENDADRAAAQTKLRALQKQRAELVEELDAMRTYAAKLDRLKGVHISKECMDNPLAKGCM